MVQQNHLDSVLADKYSLKLFVEWHSRALLEVTVENTETAPEAVGFTFEKPVGQKTLVDRAFRKAEKSDWRVKSGPRSFIFRLLHHLPQI